MRIISTTGDPPSAVTTHIVKLSELGFTGWVTGIISTMQPLVRKATLCCALACAAILAAVMARAAEAGRVPETSGAPNGSITYEARVVHHNRDNLSFVRGEVDLATGNLSEICDRSYLLNWKQVPAQVSPTRDALPSIWQVGTESCQRYDSGLPRFNSPLLRHFIVSKIIGGAELKKDDAFLSGQLVVLSADYKNASFEVVASFNGSALVIVGRRERSGEHWLVHNLAVLGPDSELYQYFIERISWSPDPPQQAIALPKFVASDFVDFPKDQLSTPVPVMPVKNWLVFRAQLPGGRQLNLVFDSGASTMIVDDWVLELDANLKPVGEMPVAGGIATAQMQQYEGFSFEVGGVKFKNLPVVGTQLTSLGFGADMRIHGIVGNEILQLCKLDIDLDKGQLKLLPLGGLEPAEGLKLNLTFINELPYVQAEVHGTNKAYLLLDTGQNSPLSVNLDYLDKQKLGNDLVMDGFAGDIAGGLAPRYMLERLGLNLGGKQYTENTVNAVEDNTYSFDGVPVIGAIGFPLLARHFSGVTFDYSRAAMYLRGAADERTFVGSPEAWDTPVSTDGWFALAAPNEARTALAGASRKPDLPQKLETGTDPRAIYAWAANKGNLSDPLDLVRAFPPGLDSEAQGGHSHEARTINRESLLLLMRDSAENVYASLMQQVANCYAKQAAGSAPPVEEPAAPSGRFALPNAAAASAIPRPDTGPS